MLNLDIFTLLALFGGGFVELFLALLSFIGAFLSGA